jgi:hypothetical protein
MSRKLGHAGLAGKNKDGNSNLPQTEDKADFAPSSRALLKESLKAALSKFKCLSVSSWI